MNKLKTPLVDKVLSGKEDLSLVDLELASMDFKINSVKAADKEEAKASPSEIYSMSSRRCSVVVVEKEGLNNNR